MHDIYFQSDVPICVGVYLLLVSPRPKTPYSLYPQEYNLLLLAIPKEA
ncbi:MAG TPA: hypothetical protein PK993_04770 [Clostridia bacterium]|nr:hypothetical protein [Clostridia bacterium]